MTRIDRRVYKTAGRQLAESVGVRVPRIYQGPLPIADLDIDALPESFVLHAVRGCSCKGVALYRREGDGFRDIRRDVFSSREDFRRDFMRHATQNEVWAEELVPDAHDLKFFMLRDRIALVLDYDRDAKLYRTMDADYQPVSGVFARHMFDEGHTHEVINRDALKEAAVMLSLATGAPFMSVDLLDSPIGVFHGELTPHPGAVYWLTKEWDDRLGQAWSNR